MFRDFPTNVFLISRITKSDIVVLFYSFLERRGIPARLDSWPVNFIEEIVTPNLLQTDPFLRVFLKQAKQQVSEAWTHIPYLSIDSLVQNIAL